MVLLVEILRFAGPILGALTVSWLGYRYAVRHNPASAGRAPRTNGDRPPLPAGAPPPTERSTVMRWLGRRGIVLLLIGISWVVTGTGIAVVPADRFTPPGPPEGPLQFMDGRPWTGLVWIVCGVVAIGAALVRRRIAGEDAYGFAALAVSAAMFCIAYLWSFGLYLYEAFGGGPPHGRATAIVGAVVYASAIVFILITAAWPDPIDAEENAHRYRSSEEE